MIALDFSGTTHQSASHNVAFNQVINQSVNQAQDHIKPITARSVDTLNPVVTTPMIALDFSGMTHQSTTHNVAFNQVINQSVNQAQDHISRFHNINHSHVHTQAAKSAQFVPQSSEFQQISPGTDNLKPSLTGHDNSAAKQLKHNFKIEENTYPKAYTNRGTLGQDFTESVERTGSSLFLKSTVPVSKLVSIGRETQEEFSATNIIQNNGGTRWQSTKDCYGEQ
ncbi:hypothetical protein F511_09245 [Dorcoceras hygrometricum]|uniref:Uncharacterized protein n=1 Tax=Dorcoceras hygrometricum TaxID=472368 RepID=A0A2Z7AGB7_9LAMI|nr:hypothetical protein F511_09245 [Dorcoceras hygrometricum]